jgi:AraC-like DNA-binding protein
MLRADALRGFEEVVAQLGGDARALLAKVQLDPAYLASRQAVLPHRSFAQLLEYAAAELACPDLGLRLAAAQDAKVLGPLEVAMRNSATLGEAFRYCADHFRAYSTGMRLAIEQDRAGSCAFLRFELLAARPPQNAQLLEHDLLLVQRIARDLSRGRVRAREIRFAHAPLSPPSTYRDHFGASVAFGQPVAGVVFAHCDLDEPIPDADPQLHELATHFIERQFPPGEPFLTTRVRALVERQLLAGDCAHESVAGLLGMHPRTLQRRLRAEGESFDAIKDGVRRDVALRYLKQPGIPLTRVAELLGYSELSVLSRSCHRWFAASPRQLRSGGRLRSGSFTR